MKQMWKVEIDEHFYKDLKKIDKKIAQEILCYILANLMHPLKAAYLNT
jgi:hypothetical protein